MGATFNRIKNWAAEILTNEDLNAEIDNILTNLTPAGIDDYSTNAAQMQVQTDPYPSSTESLATSLLGEITRLRYQIAQIIGDDVSYWYQDPPITLTTLNDVAVAEGLPGSYVLSGPTSSSSDKLALINPTGTAASVILQNTINYVVAGVSYSLDASLAVSGLQSAPSSANTCLVNDAGAADQHYTTYSGEHGTFIPVDNVGTEISNRANTLQAFKLTDGTDTEYFMGEYHNDSTLGTMLRKCRRAAFNDPSGSSNIFLPQPYTNNDTITLCKIAWIFLDKDGTAAVTYNAPTWSQDQPASPTIGDYWFINEDGFKTWSKYTASGWTASNAVLIGSAVVDGSLCVAANSVDPYKTYRETNTLELGVHPDGDQVQVTSYGGVLSVYGNSYSFGDKNRSFDLGSGGDLINGATLAANTQYYMYVKGDGTFIVSVYAPNDRRADLKGYYYPTEAWRCIGSCQTDSGTLVVPGSIMPFNEKNGFFGGSNPSQRMIISDDITINNYSGVIEASTDGTNATVITLPAASSFVGELQIIKTDSNSINVTINDPGGTNLLLLSNINAYVKFYSNGSSYKIKDIKGKRPTVQKFTSGSGTYTTPKGVTYLRVRMCGGGGGGAGSGTSTTAGNGGNGGSSTFGSSLLTANGGTGGVKQSGGAIAGGAGGTASLGTGPVGLAVTGGGGGTGQYTGSGDYLAGGRSGVNTFGGSGINNNSSGGGAPAANTGAGGGGAGGATAGVFTGAAGGAGGYIDALIYAPNATYSYAVGAGGTAGTAGTSGAVGAAGAAGIIIVEEYYG